MGLNPGFLAFLAWLIRSSNLAEMVERIVFAAGSSIWSPFRLLRPGIVLTSDAAEELDDEELELDEDEELEQLESLSESELVGCP